MQKLCFRSSPRLIAQTAFLFCFVISLGAGPRRPSRKISINGQAVPPHLAKILHARLDRLDVAQLFALAKKSILAARAYNRAWVAQGHKLDWVSGNVRDVAGKCYAQAVARVRAEVAKGVRVPKEKQAAVLARSAWWRCRQGHNNTRTIGLLRSATKLDPQVAIYWVMLAHAVWYQRKPPAKQYWAESVKYLRRAVTADPRCADAYLKLGAMMASGPRYGGEPRTYRSRSASSNYRRAYANRRHFSDLYYFYSPQWIRGVIRSLKPFSKPAGAPETQGSHK